MPLRLESRVVRWPSYFWCAATSCPTPWSNNRPPWHCLEGRRFDYVRPDKFDVIVLYSGHEISGQENRKGYLLPIDAGSNRVELTGYPLEPLMVKLAKFPSRIMTVTRMPVSLARVRMRQWWALLQKSLSRLIYRTLQGA